VYLLEQFWILSLVSTSSALGKRSRLTHRSPTSGWLLILFMSVASPSLLHWPLIKVNSTSSNFVPLLSRISLRSALTDAGTSMLSNVAS
jgi:hypothetical protein